MWNIIKKKKGGVQTNLFTKQKQSHSLENKLAVTKE